MNGLFIRLLGILLAAQTLSGATNRLSQVTADKAAPSPTNDPVEREYRKLLADDDAAQDEADQWIQDNQAAKDKGAAYSEVTLGLRIEQRFDRVRKAYEDFLLRHPEHIRARLAYGSFLNDIGKELEAKTQWEQARNLDPKNPAAWNNLGNYYGHRGPATNAFKFYEKAIELNPAEPLYYQNLATILFLFRKDAKEVYGLEEQQIFDRSLELYRKALQLDPDNFVLASDLAQTYYGIKPPRTEEALRAWEYTLKLAADDFQREGVYIHLARLKTSLGRYEEARRHLNAVTNAVYLALRDRLFRLADEKENGTNRVNQARP